MDDLGDYLVDSLPELLQLLQGSDVREIDMREGHMHVRLHRVMTDGAEPDGEAVDVEVELPTGPNVTQVTAPLVGTFYRAEKLETSPFVSEGSHVREDTVVGIIEALQVLTPVEAGCVGVVTGVLATDGQPVQYGQPLLEVTEGD